MDSLLRRFHRKVQQSGILIQAKKVRFYARQKNKNRRRVDAIRRGEIRREKETLRKLGKLDENFRERSSY